MSGITYKSIKLIYSMPIRNFFLNGRRIPYSGFCYITAFPLSKFPKMKRTYRSTRITGSKLSRLVFPFFTLAALLILSYGMTACGPSDPDDPHSFAGAPTDPDASPQTRALFENLEQIRHDHILFGHQDALAYGVHWIDEPGRSDVLEVAGSYPAIYGWELGRLEHGSERNIDNVDFEQMKGWIREGYERGGVITLSWHFDNPITGGDSWDVEGGHNVIETILPGGVHHDLFTTWLDRFDDFVRDLTAYDGDGNEYLIPVIFRPWHEMNADFFWWGDSFSSREAYRDLYRFTVEYLRDEKGLNNILWAFSPNSLSEFDYDTEFWEWYPGDKYVDILGFDDYYTTWGGYNHEDGVAKMTEYLVWLVEQAEERGKIPALTETGQEQGLTDTDWYTSQMLAAIKGDPVAERIAYLLVWRNSNEETDRQDHFYTPYPGHPAEYDFIQFTEDPLIILEDDLPDMYTTQP